MKNVYEQGKKSGRKCEFGKNESIVNNAYDSNNTKNTENKLSKIFRNISLFTLAIALFVFILSVVISPVFAVQDLMALQGNVNNNGLPITSGNLTVTIWTQATGGSLVYNSSTDYDSAITAGKFDVMLGDGTQELVLDYGTKYYMDMSVNGQDLDFNGSDRRIFQSNVGNVSGQYILANTVNTTQISDNAITNQKISASASIDKNKISLTGTWAEADIPSLTNSWSGTLNASRIVSQDLLNVNSSAYSTNTIYAINATNAEYCTYIGAFDAAAITALNSSISSSVSGSGTNQTIPMWTNGNTLGDSPIVRTISDEDYMLFYDGGFYIDHTNGMAGVNIVPGTESHNQAFTVTSEIHQGTGTINSTGEYDLLTNSTLVYFSDPLPESLVDASTVYMEGSNFYVFSVINSTHVRFSGNWSSNYATNNWSWQQAPYIDVNGPSTTERGYTISEDGSWKWAMLVPKDSPNSSQFCIQNADNYWHDTSNMMCIDAVTNQLSTVGGIVVGDSLYVGYGASETNSFSSSELPTKYVGVDSTNTDSAGFVIGHNGEPVWDMSIYDNENAKYLYLGYNYRSGDTAFTLSEGGRIGVNKQDNFVEYHTGFNGTGLNDGEAGGIYTGKFTDLFEVMATSDSTFAWRNNVDKHGWSTWSNNITMNGSDQLIYKGVTFKFGSTNGHTAGDVWYFTAFAQQPSGTFTINPTAYDEVMLYNSTGWFDNTFEAGTSAGILFDGFSKTGSYIYVGRKIQFASSYFDLSTKGSGMTMVVEYYDGTTWKALTTANALYDTTYNWTQTGGVTWDINTFSDWSNDVVVEDYPAGTYYWLRYSTTTNAATAPIFNAITPQGIDRLQVYQSPLDTVPVFSVAPNGDIVSAGRLTATSISVPIYSGFLTTPIITDNGDGSITLPDVQVNCYDNNDFTATLRQYTVAGGTTGVELPALTIGIDNVNYVVVDCDNSIPQLPHYDILTTKDLIGDGSRYLNGAVILRPTSNNIHKELEIIYGTALAERSYTRTLDTQQYAISSSSTITLSVASDLNVTVGGMDVWSGNTRYAIPTTSNDTTGYEIYHNASGDWTLSSATPARVNISYYDNGTARVPFTPGYWGIVDVYHGVEDADHIGFRAMNTEYANYEQAKAETNIAPVPKLISQHTVYVGRIIFQENNASSVVAVPYTAGSFFGATPNQNHNSLSGLLGGTWHLSKDISLYDYINSTQLSTSVSTKASSGNCPSGQVVQNTTTGGVQCVDMSTSYLASTGLILGGSTFSLNDTYVNSKYNDTGLITGLISAVNTTSNIQSLGFNTTAQLNNLYLGISDQRFNETAKINSVNSTVAGLVSSNTSTNGRIDSVNSTVAGLISSNTSTNGRIDSVNSTVAGLISSNTSTNGRIDSLNTTKATVANCAAGTVVQNTTTGGVQCVSASGITPVGSSGAIQYNNNSLMTGSIGASITSEGYLNIANTSTNPSIPTSGATLFTENIGNYSYLGIMMPGGRPVYLQPSIRDDDIAWCIPPHSAVGVTAMTCNGMTMGATIGTVSNPLPTGTNFLTQLTLSRLNSTGTANSGAEYKGAQLNWWRGNATGLGGFLFAWKGAWSTVPALGRGCVGMFGTTGALAVASDCNAALNSVYAGFGTGNTTLRICSNDGATTATCPVDCGANFPAGTAGTTAIYLVNIYTQKNGAGYWVNVQRQDTSVPDCNAFLTTDIPANSQFLTWHVFCNNGGTAAQCFVDTTKVYIGKDN